MRPYYEDGSVTIYHGDCRSLLGSVRFDSVLTDPPYFGREDLFDTRAVQEALNAVLIVPAFVFWPVLAEYPREPDAVHIWHKAIPIHPNSEIGNVAGHQYERILAYGVGRRSEVFRVAAVVPNFAACRDELTPHPTQKPLALVRTLASRLSGTILDPFMGSGTTLRAAKDLGRRAIGIEIEERWCEVAVERMAQEVLPVA